VETRYVLGSISRIKHNTSGILQDIGMNSWTLYITSNPNLLDISQHISNNIFKTREWKNTFCLNTLLTTPLSSLKSMGYPIDRILQQNKFKYCEKYQQQSTAKRPVVATPESIQNLQNTLLNSINSCNSNNLLGNINSINTQESFENI